MNWIELIKLAWQSITTNKLRSSLTVLGIIIGIAAVITLLAIGYGAKVETDKQIQALGTNVVFVWTGNAYTGHVAMGRGTALTLTTEDADAIRRICPAVDNVAPGMQIQAQVQYGNNNASTTVTGVVPEYPFVRNFHTEKGRFFNQLEMDRDAAVAVIGQTIAENLFGDEDPMGKDILIRGELFRVIGVMERKGTSAFGSDQDDQVFIPLTTGYQKMFGRKPAKGHTVHFILAQAKDPDSMLPAQFQITNLLRLRHKIHWPLTDDFIVKTQNELAQTADNVATVFSVLLGSTAGISLLVGGIGIMNIMLVSVTERTREIGIRKAIGAKYKDILLQFVIEAVVLSLSGGIIGVILGIVAAQIVSQIMSWTTIVTPLSVVISFFVSIIIGLFFGIFPARIAAKMNPIDALRTE